MKYWIYKAKRWLVHRLGGYMANECIVDPNKVKRLQCIQHYSMDRAMYRLDYSVGTLRAKAVKSFAESLIPYIVSEVTTDVFRCEYVIRTSIRVVDDRR